MVQPIRKTFDEMLTRTLDRASDIRGVADYILAEWGYDARRRDADNIDDMACFLVSIQEYRPIVNIGEYQNRRVATKTEGEWVVGKENRHGRIVSIKSKKDSFSFSMTIEDMNVVKADGSIGAFRSFILQDVTGEWYEGWNKLELQPTGLTPEILEKIGSPTVSFKHFIHPNRQHSIYGAPHLLAHIVTEIRIADEMTHWNKWIRATRDKLGIIPTPSPKRYPVGGGEKITVTAFTVKVDGAELSGEYADKFAETPEGVDAAVAYLQRLRWLQTALRVNLRASQFAFFKHALTPKVPVANLLEWLAGGCESLEPSRPAWATGPWVKGYKETPKAKTYWARLEVRPGLYLRFRTWDKTETVAAPVTDDASDDE